MEREKTTEAGGRGCGRKRRKEKLCMLQWADSLLWCREAVANKNHTHACTHAMTHKHAWARLRSQTHGRILFAPSTADKYTHKTHTCTTVAECELWSQMLAHVFKANDIQWARYWENTSFHTKSLDLLFSDSEVCKWASVQMVQNVLGWI